MTFLGKCRLLLYSATFIDLKLVGVLGSLIAKTWNDFWEEYFLKRKKCCSPTFTMKFQQRRKSPFFLAQQLITHSERELVEAFHLGENHFYQVWYKWMLIPCAVLQPASCGEMAYVFLKNIIRKNEYLKWIIIFEKDSDQQRLPEVQRDGGGPKRGRNQGDTLSQWSQREKYRLCILHVHSALNALLPECSR